MGLPDLYPAQVGSPYTTLAAPYTTGEATMTVVDATKLPTAPNIVCLAGNVAGEFSYTGKEGNVLQGVTALPGTSAATTWPVGTYAFRGIAAYDLNAIHENMVRTAGTAGQVLATAGAGALPAWADRPKRGAYDAIVYKSGTSVIAEDATGATIASGTAGTDDATVIQAALDKQGTIYIASGTYYLNSGETLSVSSNSHVYGSNNTKIRAHTTGIRLNGTKTDTTASITVAVPVASHEIVVDDASSFAVGDYILINSNRVSSYSNQVYGEIRQIFAIAGNVITFEVPTDYYYELADTPIITKLSMISNVVIEGIECYSDDSVSSSIGVSCHFSRNVTLRGLKIHSIGEAGVALYSCIDSIVDGCEIYDHQRPGEGYGIAVANACRNIAINNNSIYNVCGHCITIGGDTRDGYPTHISHDNNFLTSDGYPIDAHFGGYVTYTNNFISGGRTGTALLVLGSDTAVVKGCVFANTPGVAISPRTDTSMLRHVVISDCTFDNIGGPECVNFRDLLMFETLSITGCQFENVRRGVIVRNIGSPTTDSKMDFLSVVIANNTFTNCTDMAIGVWAKSAEYTIQNVSVTGNSIYSADNSGISVDNCNVVKISDNLIHKCGGGDSTADTFAIGAGPTNIVAITNNTIHDFGRRGIHIRDVTAATVSGNQISGSAAYTSKDTYAISAYNVTSGLITDNVVFATTDVDYNLYIKDTTGITVSNNHLQAGIPSSGVINNTHFNNIGYVTENSGAAAAVADGGTIAHGCVAAPTKVTLTGSVAGEIVTVTSISATNITVAIKKPDGSAGTTQTVYWRAEV